ncbi:MAG: transcriptional regulator, family [Solirubrobacterales bacterium]|nr:transcriptional regulator, family [Solirubrobacterales bacterium]
MPDTDPLLVGLGRAVRATGRELRISQEELGFRSGVHRNYIGGVERGERQPTVRTLATLADALGVPLSELLTLAETPSP